MVFQRFFFGVLFVFVTLPSTLYPQNVSHDGIGGYWYLDGGEVIKINSESKKIASYSNFLLGTPAIVDASDPFRVLVFYSESQSIVFLNNDGVIIGKALDFYSLKLGEITLASRAARGGVWVYSREHNEIVRLDNQFSRVDQRISLSHQLKALSPNYIIENNGILYVGFANSQITRFDSYSAALPTLNINYSNSFVVEGNYIWTSNHGVVAKNQIEPLILNLEMFQCPCSGQPITIKGIVMCFDGKSFQHCEKKRD
jgi:hypothetical protein